MKLSTEEVQKIANLARIKLTPKEVEKFQHELTDILNYVRQLDEVDTKKVAVTSQVTGLNNVKREDKVDYNFSREEMMASALEAEEGHLKVKSVF
jgi:aspartyl-tRNA(Asn)/glutamyl-tRNA(Gln) amidotransferase subunit C